MIIPAALLEVPFNPIVNRCKVLPVFEDVNVQSVDTYDIVMTGIVANKIKDT